MRRVWMYIDGYNFYYGLRNRSGYPAGLGWCNFKVLAQDFLLESDCELECIKYFTAPVGDLRNDASEEQRQNAWLNAVGTIKELKIIYGYYTGRPGDRQEKQTDVNIAVELIMDAIDENGYDTAILLSGDMDLAPAVLAVKNKLSCHKTIKVCIPAYESHERWSRLSEHHGIVIKQITRNMLEQSRFPNKIPARPSNVICPLVWQMPEG